jgi:hypothetical protein
MIKKVDEHLNLPNPKTSDSDSCDCICTAASDDGDKQAGEATRTSNSLALYYDVTVSRPGE